jgi:hypothetical protein
MNEKLIEKKLREGVKRMGGLALKFSSPYFTGMPDRIILLPGGAIRFVELKSTGKKPTRLQKERIKMLEKMGFETAVVDNRETLNALLSDLENLEQPNESKL